MNTIEVLSPRGRPTTLWHREDTTDLATIGSTWDLWGVLHDEYDLAGTRSDGVMLDVGAHIGSVCIAFLVDNPEAHAVAVEPLPENIEVLRQNAEAAGVAARLRIIAAAVGQPGIPTTIRYGPDVHRYIGNIGSAEGPTLIVPTVGLSELADEVAVLPWLDGAPRPIALLKVDCEGGEWDLFRYADRRDLDRIPVIVGEYHGRGPDELRGLLEATHDVTILNEEEQTGLFRAVLR